MDAFKQSIHDHAASPCYHAAGCHEVGWGQADAEGFVLGREQIVFKAVGIDIHDLRCLVQVSGNVRRGAGTSSGREEAAATSGVLKALGEDVRQDKIEGQSILVQDKRQSWRYEI